MEAIIPALLIALIIYTLLYILANLVDYLRERNTDGIVAWLVLLFVWVITVSGIVSSMDQPDGAGKQPQKIEVTYDKHKD